VVYQPAEWPDVLRASSAQQEPAHGLVRANVIAAWNKALLSPILAESSFRCDLQKAGVAFN
jgi:hypothetical protein